MQIKRGNIMKKETYEHPIVEVNEFKIQKAVLTGGPISLPPDVDEDYYEAENNLSK